MGKTIVLELAASGIDEAMQAVGSDPYGGSSWVGLRVPALATPNFRSRYLFLLSTFSIGARVKARILGMRQLLTIGQQVNVAGGGPFIPYVEEMEITTPFWHFSDGNASWHIQRLGKPGNAGFPPNTPSLTDPASGFVLDRNNFHRNFSQRAALLYGGLQGQNALATAYYTSLTSYAPPNAGRPWGEPVAGLGTFYDLRTENRTQGAWRAFGRGGDGIEVQGPDTFAFFCSLAQTNPSTRATQTAPPASFLSLDLREEKFIAAYSNAIYWRVGGSLIVEVGCREAEAFLRAGAKVA